MNKKSNSRKSFKKGQGKVQFLSTNPDNWENRDLLPKDNQLKLF